MERNIRDSSKIIQKYLIHKQYIFGCLKLEIYSIHHIYEMHTLIIVSVT
jgi:hypothetical protein